MKLLGRVLVAGGLAAALAGCDVDSTGSSTGGLGDEEAGAGNAGAGGADSGADGAAAGAPGAAGGDAGDQQDCPDGVTVVLSDYVSTQIALSSLEGKTRSASVLSTASSTTSGLAFALSGDVVVPSSRPESGRVVLLDRFGTNVITWLDPANAEVLGQLAVGTGFESNPSDYVEVSGDRAWVTRWGNNADPGAKDHDDGGDILIVDTEKYEIVDNLVIEPEDGLPPCPEAMSRIGDQVVVALERVNADYTEWGEARLVGFSIEKQERLWKLELEGLKNCGRPVPYPGGERWLVACSGVLLYDGTVEDVSQSALVVLDPTESPPVEVERIQAEDVAGESIQTDVVFATDTVVLLKTHTSWGGATNNRWIAYDLESGEATNLVEAAPDSDGLGKGLVYGGMVCAPGCTSTCLLTDADAGVLQRARVSEEGQVDLLDPVVVEDEVGLPPIGVTYR